MTQSEAVSFPAVVRSLFQRLHGGRGCCHAHIFSVCLVARESWRAKTTKPKAKNTPAHQGKFHLVPSSSCASAFTAHTVKGRYALCSALRNDAPDLLARLRSSLLTTAAPREISPQGRRSTKTAKAIPIFLIIGSVFLGSSILRAGRGAVSCRVSIVRFPLVRKVLSGCGVFAFLMRCIRLPHVGLFVRHHPGGPAYGTCTRAAALYPFRLAGGSAPLTPGKDERRKIL